MNIAIVDDNYDDRMKTSAYLGEFFSKKCKGLPIQTLFYEDGQDLLDDFIVDKFDIIFIDFCMKTLTGMQAAKEIRKSDNSVIIIFTTVSIDYAIDSYRVKASGYLVKPFTYDEFSETLLLIDLRQIQEKQFIELINGSERIRVLLKEIIFCDISGHYVQIHTKNIGIKRFRMAFTELSKRLEQYPQFLICYRGCMINMEQVDKIDNSAFIMTNKERIPFRRKEQQQLLRIYSDFLFENVRSGKM